MISNRLRSIQVSLDQFLPSSFHAKTFLLVTILESTVDIILESILIVRLNLVHTLSSSPTLQLDPVRTPLAVYLGIFILAHLFQLYFARDALRHKNTIQLIGLSCFNLALLVYAIIQVPEIKEIESYDRMTKSNSTLTTSSILLVIIPVCIAFCQLSFIYLTWYLFKEFGWQIYKRIGADRKIKRIYLMYQIFMCLLKFDYFFLMAFSVQLVLLVPSVGLVERVLTIIALPATLVLLVIGYYAARNEQRSIMVAFMVGLLSGSSYFIYKLFRIWQGRYDPYSYENVFKSLTVFSVSCLLMTLLSFTSAMICMRNFGKGLKVQMDKNTMIHKGTPRRRIAVTNYPTGGFGNDPGSHYHSNSSSGDDLSIHKPGMARGASGPAFELDGKNPTSSSVDILGGSEVFKLSLGQSIDGGGYLSRHVDDHQLGFDPSHPPPPLPPPFMVQDTLNRSDPVGLGPHPTTLPSSLDLTTTTPSTHHHHKMTLNPNHHPRRVDLDPPFDPDDDLNKRMSID